MKFNKFLIYLLVFLGFSCDVMQVEEKLPALNPVSIDQDGGNLKPFIINVSDEWNIPAPLIPSDAAFTTELTTVKNTVLTKEQESQLDYWGAGAVYRWNEIARELAAKYNLPPAANSEGKYPVPDPTNPLAEPKFPFCNPPYAARALAYLSVAQYDALILTWKYKFQFNRAPLYQIDENLKAYFPKTQLPSYPSEEAVVAQASFEVLSKMFPGEVPYLEEKLAAAKQIGVLAGKNLPSEVEPSALLGKAVAAKVMAVAKTDGMGAANNQAVTESQKANAVSLGFKKLWDSQESPKRPPMLPNYGNVKTWNFDKATMVSIRPKIPYIDGSAEFQKDLDELNGILKKQTREQARIANLWADGPGSYTPPGHWHRIASNTCLAEKLSEIKTAQVLAYMGTAVMDAGIACWDTKYYYFSPRPQQYGLKTSVGLPNFPSYTSGHSTFSFAGATVLSHFFPAKASEFEALAQEASLSRIYGLIHFRVDCEMGKAHGKVIGDYAISRLNN